MAIGAVPTGAAPVAALGDFPLPVLPLPSMEGPRPVRPVLRVLPWNAYLVLDLPVFDAPVVPPAMAVPYLPRKRLVYEQSVLPPRVRDALAGRLTSKLGIPYALLGQLAYALLELPVTLDQWHQPFALPRWARRPLLPLPPLEVIDAVALTRPQDLNAAPLQEPNLPRWARRPLLPLPPLEAIDPAVLTLHESVTLDKWYAPFALPRWARPPLREPPPVTPDAPLLYDLFPPDPVALLRPWFTPWAVPLWARRPLLPLPPPEAIDPAVLIIKSLFPELLQEPWPLPALRHPVWRKDTHQLGYGLLDLTPGQRPETVFVTVFDPLALPTRPPRRLRAYGSSLLDLDDSQTPETPTVDKWWAPLSRPTLPRPPLRLPWLLLAEQYEPGTFTLPLIIRLLRPMLTGGFWTGGLEA